MKPTSKQVKTSPVPYKYPNKPEGIKKKKAVKKTGVLKIPRKSMPNIKGAEDFNQMTQGAGMNDEAKLRKIRRSKQGL